MINLNFMLFFNLIIVLEFFSNAENKISNLKNLISLIIGLLVLPFLVVAVLLLKRKRTRLSDTQTGMFFLCYKNKMQPKKSTDIHFINIVKLWYS